METPRISILIDNFNYRPYLAQCIDSALAQRYPGVEVVVVDDASTDGSREVMAGYGDRIVPVVLPVNGGQAAAFNAGCRACRGDVVMLLDADDYLYPEAAERVAQAWRPRLSKIHYRLHLADAAGRVLDLYPRRDLALDSGDVVPRLLATGGYQTTVTSGNAFSREALERILPIPADQYRISADGYLVTAAPFHGPVAAVEEALGVYRLHGANAWAGEAAAGVEPFAALVRRGLRHDAEKHRALREAAQATGRRPAPAFELADPQHLENRLVSLVVDPAGHPFREDRRLDLARRGATSAWRIRGALRYRLLVAGWFLAAGLLPRPVGRRLVAWRFRQSSRPAWAARLLQFLRRSLLARPVP